MKGSFGHTTPLTESDKRLVAGMGRHLLDQRQKEQLLSRDKVVYSGRLDRVGYLESGTLEYVIEGHPVSVVFPLDQLVRFSRERLESLAGVPVRLEGISLQGDDCILLLQMTYPGQMPEDRCTEDQLMEMPDATKNGILLFTEGLKFCAFIFLLLFLGQLFDKNEPERYRAATYFTGGILLVFAAGYYYIASKKSSWLRPVPVMHFRGIVCQVLYIVNSSGDTSSDEVLYITGSQTFRTWKRDKHICPGDEIYIIYKPFTKTGLRTVKAPDVQELGKIDRVVLSDN
ncbi:hypothetical protein [Niabella beijingensis]|uniref:hypothetical protein n=1 Tax=Niabella beijingensis TaxID=2872700 RepID=UPI001CBC232A|nr:hypothetical protein [Niabella beijingensis]MBZ4192466.1 hypothetical protein [Niabella beijingensis]